MAPQDGTNTKSPSRKPRKVTKTVATVKATPMKKEKLTVVKTPLKTKNTISVRQRSQSATTQTTQSEKIPITPSSAKKPLWKPRPAHSGVPVPEKMRKYIEKRLQEAKKQGLQNMTPIIQ